MINHISCVGDFHFLVQGEDDIVHFHAKTLEELCRRMREEIYDDDDPWYWGYDSLREAISVGHLIKGNEENSMMLEGYLEP